MLFLDTPLEAEHWGGYKKAVFGTAVEGAGFGGRGQARMDMGSLFWDCIVALR